MSIPFDPSAYIAFDYKSSGDYFLPLLQAGFPYPCLHASEFEDLVDELAGDMADGCFQRVADHIAPDELGLWKMGFGEDTTYLAVVPHVHVDQFKQYWSGPFKQDPDFEYHIVPRLRLVAPGKGAVPAAPKKAKRPTLIEDVYPCESMLELDIDCPVSLVWERQTDKANEGRFVDFSVWPPVDVPVPGTREDRRFVSEWRPLFWRGERDLWRQRVRDDSIGVHENRFRLVQVDRISPWTPVFLGGGAVIGDAHFNSKVVDGAVLHVSETVGKKGKPEYAIMRISADRCESWYTTRKPLQLYPFPDSARRVLHGHQDGCAHEQARSEYDAAPGLAIEGIWESADDRRRLACHVWQPAGVPGARRLVDFQSPFESVWHQRHSDVLECCDGPGFQDRGKGYAPAASDHYVCARVGKVCGA